MEFVIKSVTCTLASNDENLDELTEIIEVDIPGDAFLLDPVKLINPIEDVPIPTEDESKLLLMTLIS
jgi:hypothetical protein